MEQIRRVMRPTDVSPHLSFLSLFTCQPLDLRGGA
jgi:hypothetical protein